MKKKALVALVMIIGATQLFGAPVWWQNMTERLKTVPGAAKRVWECQLFQNKCTKEEINWSNRWILGGAATAIAVFLAAYYGPVSVRKIQAAQRRAAEQVHREQERKAREEELEILEQQLRDLGVQSFGQ